ncbi:5-formyltetrahydrofolate cyclo-ligase [Pseudomonas panipatensis]|uniref:5-formyltetrahydrofolate cyclo-ligase n=1 Tax=Pseudomonas panipatensis TaxID=428992 RepID=A0A1G8J3I4_9PSED|nr:5-formyltetrahydrofolate cyclo-ligase [Pseudomonas panipatensis]SDI25848.1 5-formyltetrahydrofolate cyclo-ligase [Pseudomonas panipatensis]SMP49431.1 5-formyltetrahydrofolate cyclo-ligase [Pseudomonas panipatensis]
MIHVQDHSRAALRRLLRQARRALTPLQQRRAAQALYRQMAQHPLFRRARHIALYLPADGEIDPRPLLRAAQKRGKRTYLPVLSRWPQTHMSFQRVGNGERWTRNRFRIAEPLADRARQRATWTLDLVLLPLVGFDEQGGRLGMGKGFYDRALGYLGRRKTWRKPTLLGLAHECQKVDRLDLASWDVPLGGIVSDAGWYGALASAPRSLRRRTG